MIQTQIKWKKNKNSFHSYHLSGWADPENTESMTTQELTVFGSKRKNYFQIRNLEELIQ